MEDRTAAVSRRQVGRTGAASGIEEAGLRTHRAVQLDHEASVLGAHLVVFYHKVPEICGGRWSQSVFVSMEKAEHNIGAWT